jgi:hypothetical protein
MIKVSALLALALAATPLPAYADAQDHKTQDVAPMDKPDLPQNPLDVPGWVGNAIDHILTGEDQPKQDRAPQHQ